MTAIPKDNPTLGRQVDVDALRAFVQPVVVAHGLELVDVEWASARGGQILRVYIERPDVSGATRRAGVTVDDCAAISRDLSTALDVEELIDRAYHLEVSSPGLNRPLKTIEDFRRQIGRLAKVRLLAPAPDGQTVLRGTITGANDTGFDMDVDGNGHQVALQSVRDAKLVFEVGGQSKQPKGNKRRISSETG